MMRSAFVLVLLASAPVIAQPRPCNVVVARAPDAVRAEIDRWVRDEPRCATPLEVRVIETADGLYLFARDGRGFTRQRLVPDAASVGALVVSWAADDTIDGAWVPDRPVLPPVATSSPASRRTEWVGIGTGLVGLAAIGVGAVYHLRAQEISDQISMHSPTTPWPDDIHAIEARGQSYERYGMVFLGVGAAAAAAGTVVYIVGHSRRTEHVMIAPSAPSRNAVGLALGGSF
jgi:hypothetical protein